MYTHMCDTIILVLIGGRINRAQAQMPYNLSKPHKSCLWQRGYGTEKSRRPYKYSRWHLKHLKKEPETLQMVPKVHTLAPAGGLLGLLVPVLGL